MKKVIDANFFQNPELENYLKSDKGNMVVFTDCACMEAHKGNALENLPKSLEIVSKFPEQVLVLKGTRDVVKLTLTSDGFKNLVDTDQTEAFRIFCFRIPRGILCDVNLVAQILKQEQFASAYFDKLKNDAAIVANGIEELAKSFKKEHLRAIRKREVLAAGVIDKIARDILWLTSLLFQGHPDVQKIPKAEQVRNSYVFRFAVSAYILSLRWISDGGPGTVKLDKLRNDSVDMNYVAYATFFDGILTRDSKMKEIYLETCFLLKNVFEAELGISSD
jgi:hypothetical protein